MKKTTTTAALRFILNSSMQKATITSSMEMEEVRAASSSATKKKMAINPPSGIWPKMIEGMHTYTPDELNKHLTAAGLREITIKRDETKHWLAVTATI